MRRSSGGRLREISRQHRFVIIIIIILIVTVIILLIIIIIIILVKIFIVIKANFQLKYKLVFFEVVGP